MRVAFLTLTLTLLATCTPPLRRFSLAPAMVRDDDRRPIPRVAQFRNLDAWDFTDQTVFRPLLDATSVRLPTESIDVNALDEVPDSSWFTNRIGAREVPLDELANGSCTTPPLDVTAPWHVVTAKQDGFNPGFVVLAPDGHRYVLKADGDRQTELASAADAISARIYHALGYFTPCNRVVHFDRRILVVDTHSESIGPEVVDRVLRQATRLPDGTYRMSASRYIDGIPAGPFTYQGLRADDANDVVPHEQRRELRGSRLVGAWLNHYDTRQQNTLDSWIAVPGGGYLQHYLIDFGDAFGAAWPWDVLTARSGRAYAADFGQIAVDFVSAGSVIRPWDHARIAADAWVFTYFNATEFDPEAWRPISPNPAFTRMSERDAAWMARMIAQLSRAQLHAAIGAGAFTHPEWADYLERVLAARRETILSRYLSRLSPLTSARVEGDRICARDLARSAGVSAAHDNLVNVYAGSHLERQATARSTLIERDIVCTQTIYRDHSLAGLSDNDARRYLVVDMIGAARGDAPLRVHAYDLDTRGIRIVGLERPDHATPPRL